MDRCDVVVLGAGLAGLSAATDLSEAGPDVAVLEARNRVITFSGTLRSIWRIRSRSWANHQVTHRSN